jgi:hypothetical protein
MDVFIRRKSIRIPNIQELGDYFMQLKGALIFMSVDFYDR